jgi:hypothetical protein
MLKLRITLSVLAFSVLLATAAYAASSSKSFTITNTGDGPLTITGAVISGNTAEYALTGNTCSSVPVGQACALTVSFTPNGYGTRTAAALNFSSNGTNGPSHSIALSGSGYNPLITPNFPAVTSCKHANWLATGYSYLYTHSNGCSSASAGSTIRFQTRLDNNTTGSRLIRVHVSVDNAAHLFVNGVQVSPFRYYPGFTSFPSYDAYIQPGANRVEIHVVNDGSSANPAAFSAAIFDVASGALLRSTSETTQWTYY